MSTNTPETSYSLPRAILILLASAVALAAVIAGGTLLILSTSRDHGWLTTAIVTAVAIALAIGTHQWGKRRSETLAVALSEFDETDERRRLLALKANAATGKAMIYTITGIFTLLIAASSGVLPGRDILLATNAEDGIRNTLAVLLWVYIVVRFGAARYYSRRG